MSSARFIALEKEDLNFMEVKSVSGKNKNIFMKYFRFLVLHEKQASERICFSHLYCQDLLLSFKYVFPRVRACDKMDEENILYLFHRVSFSFFSQNE